MSEKESIFNWESLKFRRMVGLAGVVIAGLIFFFGAKKNMDQRKSLEAKTTQVRADTAKEEADLKVFEARLSEEGRSLTSALLIALPPSFQADEEYARLVKLGEVTDTPVLNYGPGDPQALTDHTEVSLGLSLECTFENCLRFMNGLHSSVQLLDNQDLIARGPIWKASSVALEPGGERGKLNMTLAGVLYSAPPSAPVSGTPPPPAPQGETQ